MRKHLLVLSLFLISCHAVFSQTWEKIFSGLNEDYFRCVIEVPSGGYIAAGYTSNFTPNDTDAFAVRLDNNGDTIWTFRYNGNLSKKDLFYKVINTSDGGFALCGYSSSVTGLSDDAMYLKLNSSGQLQWVKFWGGSNRERGQDIQQTSDGGFVIVGYTASAPAQYYDAFILRTNSSGVIQWTNLFGGANYDDANSVKLLPDGGFILGGQSNNGINGLDQFLVRTNENGVALWSKRFGTTGTDNIEYLILVNDGFIMAGGTNTPANGDNGYVVKTDTAGNVIWTKSYGNSKPNDFHRIESTSDGGFVAIGTTRSNLTSDSLPNFWLMKLNADGDSMWSKTYGGESNDHGYSGQQTSDGGYIIAGHTGSFRNNAEAYVIKTNSSGVTTNKVVYTTVYDLITPTAATCGSANTQIKLRLLNLSNQSIPNIPVTVIISGAISDTITQTFSQSDTVVTLNTTINTSAGGTYTFYCYTSNNNDIIPDRNFLTRTFTINVTPAAPVVTSNSRCGSGSVSLTASAATPVYWYTAPTGGSLIFTGNTYNTPSLSNTTTYYAQTGTSCPSTRIPVTASINPIPVDPIPVGDSRCGNGTLTLTASASDPISWFDVSTGGVSLFNGNSFTTPVLSSTVTYYVEASNANCKSNRLAVLAEVNTAAPDPGTTGAQRCGPGTVDLAASSPHNVYWYDSPVGGTQVGNGPIFTTPSLSVTTTFYAQADNGCLSGRIPAVGTINAIPADPITTSANNCGPGSVVLEATSNKPVLWFDAAVGGNQVGFGSILTTPVLNTTTIFYAQASNASCLSARVPATAAILSFPTINLGNDTMVTGLSYILDAGAGFPFYSWSNSQSTQTINITTPGNYCVTVTDANGCSNNDCIFIDLVTSVNETPFMKMFSVSPNPSAGLIRIDFPSMMSQGTIELMDITGKIIIRQSLVNTINREMNLSKFPKGIYLVRVNSGKHTEVKKLVLQ